MDSSPSDWFVLENTYFNNVHNDDYRRYTVTNEETLNINNEQLDCTAHQAVIIVLVVM